MNMLKELMNDLYIQQPTGRPDPLTSAVDYSVRGAAAFTWMTFGFDFKINRKNIENIRESISSLQRILAESDSMLVDLAASLPQEDE